MGRSPEYPQRIRVASVFEPFDCSMFVCLLVYMISQYTTLHYCRSPTLRYIGMSIEWVLYWPAPPSIHRGLEWPQCLKCSLLACLLDCLQIFSFLARDPDYPQRIRVASVFEPLDCLLDCSLLVCLSGSKFSHFSSPHLLFYSTVGPLPRVSTED